MAQFDLRQVLSQTLSPYADVRKQGKNSKRRALLGSARHQELFQTWLPNTNRFSLILVTYSGGAIEPGIQATRACYGSRSTSGKR